MNLKQRSLQMAWAVVLALLIAGISLPMFTFSKFYFFNDSFSLVTGIFHLLDKNEVFLFVVLFSFSLAMPAYKMLLLCKLIFFKNHNQKQVQRDLKLLFVTGKWSMLDVFVIAILLVVIKLGTIAEVQVHLGLYLFCSAVIGSMILTQQIADYAQKK